MKRVLTIRQVLHVDAWQETVLHWLNGGWPENDYTEAGKKRINELIVYLHRLVNVTAEWRRLAPLDDGSKHFWKRKFKAELSHVTATVGRRIERYPSWPNIGWTPGIFLDLGETFGESNRRAMEGGTAHCLISLACASRLDRLRQCACQSWFFGRTRNQKSCSAKCRHRIYERTDDFKRKRRQYMKRYNELQRSGRVR
jgi:hypothetical protein